MTANQKKEVAGMERVIEKIQTGGGMSVCKRTQLLKGEVFSLDRCLLMGDPGIFSPFHILLR